MTLECSFCGKECKNNNSLRNHERLCKENPKRQISSFARPDVRKSILETIAKKPVGKKFITTDKDRKRLSERMSNISKKRTDEWNKENGKRISATINKKVSENEWHTSLAKGMHIEYKGIDLHGTWELKYAIYLDANGVKWIRNKEQFEYEFEGKIRKYIPDFYLLNSKEFIEIKGYKTEKDIAKWEQFPKEKNLIVLMKKDLQFLGLI